MTHGQLSIGQFVVPFEIPKKLYLHYIWHVFCTSSIFSVCDSYTGIPLFLVKIHILYEPFTHREDKQVHCVLGLNAEFQDPRAPELRSHVILCDVSAVDQGLSFVLNTGTFQPSYMSIESLWWSPFSNLSDMKETWCLESEICDAVVHIWRHYCTLCFIAARQKLVIILPSGAILHGNQWMAIEVANRIEHSLAKHFVFLLIDQLVMTSICYLIHPRFLQFLVLNSGFLFKSKIRYMCGKYFKTRSRFVLHLNLNTNIFQG